MYFRQPRYYKDFYCLGGACVDNCCHDWRIDWTNDEVNKVKSASAVSSELRELIENSFLPQDVEEYQFKIKFNVHGYCPFLTEQGLCRIQKELGAEYLSYTCMNYPRYNIITKSFVYRFCHFTCPEVMKVLLNDDRSTDLVNVEAIGKASYVNGTDTTLPNWQKECPELRYYPEIFEFFYEIISDKKRNVEDSLVLGGLAAQALSKVTAQGDFEQIPETIKKLKAQMHNQEQLKSIENIKPNYNIKLGICGQLLKLFCVQYKRMDSTIALTDSDGKFNIDLYTAGEGLLQEHLKEKPYAMRNIALNLLFELMVPIKNDEFSIFENYAVYVTTFAMLKLNTIAIAELQNRVNSENRANYKMDEFIIRSASTISRTLSQGIGVDKLIMAVLTGNKMLSPAYLALLIK